MPDLPAWATDILRQSPMVAIAIIIFFLADRRLAAKEIRLETRYDKGVADSAARDEKLRAEVRQDRDAEIQRFQEAQKVALAAKDEQIASLTKEVTKLTKRLDELLKNFGGK